MLIRSFTEELAFLSNFYYCNIIDKHNRVWPTAEHIYQAYKSLDLKIREQIRKHP